MKCVHEWRWLPAVHVTLDHPGHAHDYRNCECVKCGLRAWMHGTGPNAPAVTTLGERRAS